MRRADSLRALALYAPPGVDPREALRRTAPLKITPTEPLAGQLPLFPELLTPLRKT